ncbi:ABC transporter ATP-binding protein [Paenibacillus filicis]|uniref:ABC transporter ATP-binding protein n=1 Tax=Paenibacillus filicis TaxID=669464 RepID=A0ABU9DCF2_9BACL
MSSIRIEHLSKYFGRSKGIDDADLHIQQGEFFTLLGPSGCGKTTLLRTLAGFYRQEEGHIYFDDRLMDDEPVYNRDTGMVFQNYAIFPHLSVFENVAYGLKARKVKKPELERRVMEALELVELGAYRDRQPSEMSGGQQQRIALARAIVIHPGLLLMDEPLSNLDAKLRLKMRAEIRALQQKLSITTVYVTHDQEEALAVSDRIAVLSGGRIQQIGRPHEIYLNPANRIVADFIGTSNFLPVRVAGYDEASCKAALELGGQRFTVRLDKPYEGEAIVSIRPEHIRLDPQPEDGQAVLGGTVSGLTFLGEKVEYIVDTGAVGKVQVHAYQTAYDSLHRPGQAVSLSLDLACAVIFDGQGREAVKQYATR